MSVASLSYSNVERCMSMVVSIGEKRGNVNGGIILKVSLDAEMKARRTGHGPSFVTSIQVPVKRLCHWQQPAAFHVVKRYLQLAPSEEILLLCDSVRLHSEPESLMRELENIG